MSIWINLRAMGISYGHLVYFEVIWYIFPRFGILYQEKSGNPALGPLQKNKQTISSVMISVAQGAKYATLSNGFCYLHIFSPFCCQWEKFGKKKICSEIKMTFGPETGSTNSGLQITIR
jgi:hypothetical protein